MVVCFKRGVLQDFVAAIYGIDGLGVETLLSWHTMRCKLLLFQKIVAYM